MRLAASRMALVCSVLLPVTRCGGRTGIDDLLLRNVEVPGNPSHPNAAPDGGAGGARPGSTGSDGGLPDRTFPDDLPDVGRPDGGHPDTPLRDAGPLEAGRIDGGLADAARTDGEAGNPPPDADRLCAPPLLFCFPNGNAQCVDPHVDNANCGTCGNACSSKESCVQGRCTPCASAYFLAPETYTTGVIGSESLPPIVEDLDGDGRLDVLVANTGGSSLSLFRGDGKGHLSGGEFLDTQSAPLAVRIGDINQDGYKDIVTLTAGELVVRWGSSDHRFSKLQVYGVAPAWDAVAASGLDLFDAVEDNAPDAVVYMQTGSTLTVKAFAGGAFWGTPPQVVYEGTASRPIRKFQAVDTDDDGDTDVVLLGETVNLLAHDGPGKFELLQALIGASATWVALQVVDLNGDGRPDVAGESYGGVPRAAMGNASHAFELQAVSGDAEPALATSNGFFADLNGDRMSDLVARSFNANVLSVFLGNALGEFRHPASSNIAGGRAAITLADLTGDGRLDLVASHGASDALSVHEGKADGTFRSDMLALPQGTTPYASTLLPAVGAEPMRVITVGGTDEGRLRVFSILDSTQVSMTCERSIDSPSSVSLSDLDGDGAPDAIVPASRALYWLRNLGNGQFADPAVISDGSSWGLAFAGDLDGDGRPEVVHTSGKGSSSFMLQILKKEASSNAWSHSDYPLNGYATGDAAVGDITGDGLDDVVVAAYPDSSSSSSALLVWLGSRSGTLVSKGAIPLGASGRAHIHDLDGDGISDVFVGYGYQGYAAFRGDPNANLQAMATGTEPISFLRADPPNDGLLFADIDHDGVLDILATSDDRLETVVRNAGVTLWLGLGQGRFERTETYRVPGANIAVGVGDIDKDGIDDLLLSGGNRQDRSLMWLRGGNRCR